MTYISPHTEDLTEMTLLEKAECLHGITVAMFSLDTATREDRLATARYALESIAERFALEIVEAVLELERKKAAPAAPKGGAA